MDWAQIKCIFLSHINARQEISIKISKCVSSNVNNNLDRMSHSMAVRLSLTKATKELT